jgi:hypothetical protein
MLKGEPLNQETSFSRSLELATTPVGHQPPDTRMCLSRRVVPIVWARPGLHAILCDELYLKFMLVINIVKSLDA